MMLVMRASDHARERTVALLRRRWREGYLSLDTFECRVEEVYRASSAEQLACLSADLPAIGPLARLRQWGAGRHAPPAAPAAGLRLPLELVGERGIVLGRGARCDVVVAHDTVSRRHATIRRDDTGCHVTDLDSTNGTWIHGRRARPEQTIRRGDQILLGGCLVLIV